MSTERSAEQAVHVLKVVPPYFDALLDGTKTFEVRRNDRGFQKGDQLILWEYDQDATSIDDYRPAINHAVSATVAFVYSGDPRFGYGGQHALNPGWVVLGLAGVEEVSRG